MLIKAVLIAAVLGVGAVLIRGHGARRQALRRLGLAVFAVLAVISILQPDSLTWLARQINVGRGADLLLYALIVVFFSYVATRYLRDARTVDQLTAIARRLALDQAPPPRPGQAGPTEGAARPPVASPGDGLGRSPEDGSGNGLGDGLGDGLGRSRGDGPGRSPAGGPASSGPDGQAGPAQGGALP
jgi:hypothetical protein